MLEEVSFLHRYLLDSVFTFQYSPKHVLVGHLIFSSNTFRVFELVQPVVERLNYEIKNGFFNIDHRKRNDKCLLNEEIEIVYRISNERNIDEIICDCFEKRDNARL